MWNTRPIFRDHAVLRGMSMARAIGMPVVRRARNALVGAALRQALEEQNLFFIQNSQETEYALDELKQNFGKVQKAMDAKTQVGRGLDGLVWSRAHPSVLSGVLGGGGGLGRAGWLHPVLGYGCKWPVLERLTRQSRQGFGIWGWVARDWPITN